MATATSTCPQSDRTCHLLHRLTDLVANHATIEQLLDFVYEGFHEVIAYDRIGFAVVDIDRDRAVARWAKSKSPIKLRPGYAARISGSTLELILQDRKPRILDDLGEYYRTHPYSEATRLLVEEGMCSSLTCPLVVAGRPVGLLFFNSTQPHQYTAQDTDLNEDIAEHLALLIEQIQTKDNLRAAREQYENEHDRYLAATETAQRSLHSHGLPVHWKKLLFPESFAQPDGYHLLAQFTPGEDSSGCLLDLFQLKGHHSGIVMADCSNQGDRSFLLMATIRTILRTTDWGTVCPSRILAQLNEKLAHSFPYGSFASALVVVFDPLAGIVHWANAGHPAPWLIRSSGYVIDPVVSAAMMVTRNESPVLFDVDSAPLNPGDKLLVCSPGVLRARFHTNPSFGQQQFHRTLELEARNTGRELIDHMAEALRHYLQGEPPSEDLILFEIERSAHCLACQYPQTRSMTPRQERLVESVSAISNS